jgi:hypothetical protein
MIVRIFSTMMFAFTISVPAFAQTDITGAPNDWRGTPIDGSASLVSTNKYGEPQFVSVEQDVAPSFSPAEITGDRLADEFKSLCLDTKLDLLKLQAATQKSTFAWAEKSLTIEPKKKGKPAYVARYWHTGEARVQIWAGDTSGMDGYGAISRWRRGATISPFNSNRTLIPSCSLTVMARGFTSPE